MSLHSPIEFSQIVNNYLDGYLKRGWMPECRANNVPGWTQVRLVYPCSPTQIAHDIA
jgi:hypothetical protein